METFALECCAFVRLKSGHTVFLALVIPRDDEFCTTSESKGEVGAVKSISAPPHSQ